MNKLCWIVCDDKETNLFEGRYQGRTRGEALKFLKQSIGRRTLNGLVFIIIEIPVPLLRGIVAEILAGGDGNVAPAANIVPLTRPATEASPGRYDAFADAAEPEPIPAVATPPKAKESKPVKKVNGKLVTVEVVKQWMSTLGVYSLFGVYSVRVINEMDRCTRDAQDLLLSYLDRLPPGRAVIGTSNLQLEFLTERFQTRFQSIKLAAPSTEEIATMLRRQWLVELVRPHTVVLITARPETWTTKTLDRIEEQTGWRPQDACFAPKGRWNPPAIKEHLLKKDVFPIHGDDARYIAIESNPRTREMYARFSIPFFWVTTEGTCLTQGTRIVKRLPR